MFAPHLGVFKFPSICFILSELIRDNGRGGGGGVVVVRGTLNFEREKIWSHSEMKVRWKGSECIYWFLYLIKMWCSWVLQPEIRHVKVFFCMEGFFGSSMFSFVNGVVLNECQLHRQLDGEICVILIVVVGRTTELVLKKSFMCMKRYLMYIPYVQYIISYQRFANILHRIMRLINFEEFSFNSFLQYR